MDRLFDRYPLLTNVRLLAVVFAGIVVAATLPRLSKGPREFNNYTIFSWSFHNLDAGTDLYAFHPDQHLDLFKYSPTFAVLMAPFWFLPRWAGLLLWNLLNGGAVFWAVGRLNLSAKRQTFVLLFVALELFGSIQNGQSNGLMAGLMIGAFSAFERRQPLVAALLISLGFYVKLFAIVTAVLFVFYPKQRLFLAAMVGWMALLGGLPLLVTSPARLMDQYAAWLQLLANDPAHDMNYSWMTLTQSWFQFTAPDSYYLVPGAALLLLPLARRSLWSEFGFRLTYLAALLIWVVIFNHKAESPTYVIAVCGVALWAVAEPRDAIRRSLLWFTFVFTILSASDVFPSSVKVHIWQPWRLKALPCLVVWCWMTWELLWSREFGRHERAIGPDLPAEPDRLLAGASPQGMFPVAAQR